MRTYEIKHAGVRGRKEICRFYQDARLSRSFRRTTAPLFASADMLPQRVQCAALRRCDFRMSGNAFSAELGAQHGQRD
jgi:hypothetical protein